MTCVATEFNDRGPPMLCLAAMLNVRPFFRAAHQTLGCALPTARHPDMWRNSQVRSKRACMAHECDSAEEEKAHTERDASNDPSETDDPPAVLRNTGRPLAPPPAQVNCGGGAARLGRSSGPGKPAAKSPQGRRTNGSGPSSAALACRCMAPPNGHADRFNVVMLRIRQEGGLRKQGDHKLDWPRPARLATRCRNGQCK